jgi:hypothetical protein
MMIQDQHRTGRGPEIFDPGLKIRFGAGADRQLRLAMDCAGCIVASMEPAPISEAALAGLASGALVALLLTVGWFHYEYCYATNDLVDGRITLATTPVARMVVPNRDHPVGNP